MSIYRLPLGLPVIALVMFVCAAGVQGAITLGPDGEEILAGPEARNANLLGPEYKDEAHGFKIELLSGARIVQRGAVESSLERLSFVHDDKDWGGTIETALFKTQTYIIEDYLKNSAAQLSSSFSAVQVLESRTTTISKKPAGKLVASLEATAKAAHASTASKTAAPAVAGKVSLLKQELAVQVAPNEFLVLTLYGPLAAKNELIRTFDAMMQTFEVVDRQEVKERRVAAIKAGKQWFLDRSAEELRPRLIAEPQLFRVKIQGKDVGYVRFDEREDTVHNFKGIVVTTNSRTFPQDGSVVMSQSTLFWAYPHQSTTPEQIVRYSNWDSGVKTVTFDAMRTMSFWSTELGYLQYQLMPKGMGNAQDMPGMADESGGLYVLSVKRTQGNDAKLLNENPSSPPSEWPIGVSQPTPLPRVMEYLWPRVVDLSKPTQMAFVVFNSNSNTEKLGLRTLSVIGPDTVSIDGKTTATTKIVDELDPGSTTRWVDNTGKTIMMRTSDNSLFVPTTEAKMAQLWGARLAKLPQGASGKP